MPDILVTAIDFYAEQYARCDRQLKHTPLNSASWKRWIDQRENASDMVLAAFISQVVCERFEEQAIGSLFGSV